MPRPSRRQRRPRAPAAPEHHKVSIRLIQCQCVIGVLKPAYLEIGCSCCQSTSQIGYMICERCSQKSSICVPDLTGDDAFRTACPCPTCLADLRWNRDMAIVTKLKDDLAHKRLQPEDIASQHEFVIRLLEQQICRSGPLIAEYNRLHRLWTEKETQMAEEARIQEEARIKEEARIAEEARMAEEARIKEEARVQKEADAYAKMLAQVRAETDAFRQKIIAEQKLKRIRT